jgi:DNA-binding beta-propeller fold protein YncE
MAFDAAGSLYVIDTSLDELLKVNKGTGAVVSIQPLSVPLGAWAGMAVDPTSGAFYVADGGTGGTGLLYTMNPADGQLTPVGSTGVANGLAGLTFLPEPTTGALWISLLSLLLRRRG